MLTVTGRKVDLLVDLVRRRYPGWTGFQDPRFLADESGYKREASKLALAELAKPELERLKTVGDLDTLRDRMRKVAHATNLLWYRVPHSGDLVILDDVKHRFWFCRQSLDLLYGDEPVGIRLSRWSREVAGEKLPNKWTFPTYFLFLCHPESEMFVKPTVSRWFLRFIGDERPLGSSPSQEAYVRVKESAYALRDRLTRYGPQDMIDIQGFVWVCHQDGRAPRARAEIQPDTGLSRAASAHSLL